MASIIGSYDHRDNEYYAYRYSSRLSKGDLVEIRSGFDLEVARFQARKHFPEVLNEYWWLKPSDVAGYRELPLQITEISYYHGGVPVAVMLTANGSIVRKAQIFLRKREEPRNALTAEQNQAIDTLSPAQLLDLLDDPSLLFRSKAYATLRDKHPEVRPTKPSQLANYHVMGGDLQALGGLGEVGIQALIERFFVTSQAKESERILEALIAIGPRALPRLEDMAEYLSDLASPFYSKRINWTIRQLKSNRKNSLV